MRSFETRPCAPSYSFYGEKKADQSCRPEFKVPERKTCPAGGRRGTRRLRGGGGAGVVSSNGLMVVRDRSMFVPVEGVVVAKESRRISECDVTPSLFFSMSVPDSRTHTLHIYCSLRTTRQHRINFFGTDQLQR